MVLALLRARSPVERRWVDASVASFRSAHGPSSVARTTYRDYMMLRSVQRAASTAVRVSFVAAMLATAFPLRQSTAQTTGGPASSQSVPLERTHVFAINPLGIPFEIVSVEVEQAIQGAFSVSGNFSYFSPSDYTRSSFEVKGHLYPNEFAPGGFGVGLGVGLVNTREHRTLNAVPTLVNKTNPSIAVYADYNWLLGRSERFYVGTGLGAKRILGNSDVFDKPPFVYGTVRFLIGVAF
jgi:hypothetical protein